MDLSDEDDDDRSSASDCPVLLGFLSRVEAGARLSPHQFPSKVGGSPVWLEPAHLPDAAQLACGHSGRPLKFLLQVYAPVDREPTAFHRTVFLFVSPQGNQLQQPGAVRAFRSQLPRANQFYAFEPAEDDAAALGSATPAAVAGWVDAAPFPEWELVTDEEPSDGAAAGGAAAELPTAEPAASLAPAATGSGDQEQEEDGGEEDMADFEDSAEQAHFSAFTARVARDPEQVLRYGFDGELAPLWPSRAPVPVAEDVPPCSRCGALRRFEFQVMPQILNFLGIDASDAAGLDFGTVAVYSCSNSCALLPDGERCAYAEEFVFVQPPASEQGARRAPATDAE